MSSGDDYSDTTDGEDSPPPKQRTKADYRTQKKKKAGRKVGKKVLNFTSNPDLALPILEMVKHEGYSETLAHGKKTDFFKKVIRLLFAPGAALGR